nr:retrovirus-related Pol polyprotein from transposon TNT 1-94 [Tanacetum cinerariifolium]
MAITFKQWLQTDDSPAIPEHTTVETPMNMSPANKAHFEAEKEAIHLILTGIGYEIYSTVDACQTAQEITHTATRHKGKEIAKLITQPSETASEEDNDPEHAQRDKYMQKNLDLIAKNFKHIYKPTNNNLRTSSNSRNKNVDTNLCPVVQQSGIQCFNCKEFGHFAKECRKLKRVKDSAYHNKKMLLCKQAEQGVPLQAEQYDWLADTDKEIDEHELEAHYSYMAKIQEVPTADSSTDSEPWEQDGIHNDQNDVASVDEHVALANLITNLKLDVDETKKNQKKLKKANTTLAQELKECKTILAETSNALRESISVWNSCLVALQTKQTKFEKYKAFNDRAIDYDKLEQIVDNAWIKHLKDQFRAPTTQDMEILIQTCLMPLVIKTQNDSFIFVHELKQEMHADLKYVESLKKEIDELESDKAEFSNMYDMILQEFWNEKASNVFQKEREQYVKIQDSKAQLQDKKIAISELKKLIEKGKGKSVDTKPSVVQQPNAQRLLKPSVLGVNHKTNVSRTQHRSNQLKDKVVLNNSQVKLKKTQVEVYPNIPSVSNKMKSVTTCKDSLNSRTLNANAVYASCNKCLVDSNHFTCVTKMLNDMKARTKKPNVVPISIRKPKIQANKSVATHHKNKVASKSTNQKPQSYYRMMYERTNGQFCDEDLEVAFRKSTCFIRDIQGNDLLTDNRGFDLYTISFQESASSTLLCLMAKASPTQAWLWHRRLSHLNFDYINLLSKKDVVIGLPKLKYVKDQLCSSCELSKAKRSSFKSKAVPSSKGRLNLLHMDLCGPMRVASINGKKYILSKGYRVYNKRKRMIVESIHICFDEIKKVLKTSIANDTSSLVPQRQKASDYDNSDPVRQLQNVSSSVDAHLPSQQELDLLFGPLYDEFFNAEVAESSSHNIGNSNVPTFNQSQVSEYRWTKDHSLEQVRGNPSRPVQTRRQLVTDPGMCVSNDVLVSIEGVEELKRNVWIKGENKAALPTLYVDLESIHMLSVFTKVNSDNSLHAEIEPIKRKSIEIQNGLQARINIFEKDVQRCEKQSVDFELKLQQEKEKHKWDSTLQNNNTKSLDYSWNSKMEKLEHENVSLDFKMQSLIKEHDNVKIEYQKLFDSIKRHGMNAASSVRRSMNKDSRDKNSVLAIFKNSAKKVIVYVRKNKQTDNTFTNVISNKENVIDVDVAN